MNVTIALADNNIATPATYNPNVFLISAFPSGDAVMYLIPMNIATATAATIPPH